MEYVHKDVIRREASATMSGAAPYFRSEDMPIKPITGREEF